MTIIAIGDIHGEIDKLYKLIKKINPHKETLIFLGDYIDRGSHSKQVIDYLLSLKESGYKVIALRGNHEDMLLNALTDHGTAWIDMWAINGGRATLASYDTNGKDIKIPENHIEFIKSMPLYYETEKYIFVHATVRADTPMEEQMIDDLLWGRFYFKHKLGKVVVCGHTPVNDVTISKNYIMLDTGACFKGGKLSAIILPENRVVQV